MTSTTLAAGVRLHRLTKSYGATRAVAGLDLVIAPGETVALLGPNGAGKSTTLDLLLGLARPDGGEVSLLGMPPRRATRSGRVGAMLQSAGLLPQVTVRELVELTAALYPRPMAVDEVLVRAGVADLADRRTTALSGGQAQRVRFALAIVPDPDLIVLDEPTAAMDVQSRRAFWESMRAFAAAGRTVLFATHYLEEADAYADRVVLMAAGRVVADGPSAEVKALVGGRTIRCALAGADPSGLARLPGVTGVEVHGENVTLHCADGDRALRALLAAAPDAHRVEVTGADLETAFLALTTGAA